jgi:hypothetical protein
MQARLITNIALLAIVAILGALAFLEPGKEQPETKVLADVNTSELTKITLKNKEEIVFEKQQGHWRLVAPIQAPANEIRVRQLMDIVKSASEADYPVKQDELAKFELAPPKATLTLGKAVLAFGGSDPINMRRYVQVGDTLHLVSDDFFHHLQASATDYVDKKLLPEGAKVREIEVPGLKARLGQDGKWTKEAAPDNKSDIPELATLWATARAIDVRRLEQQPPQGDKVKIGLAEGGPVEFIIVRKEPEPILARPELGLQYELTGETARQLLNLPKPAPVPSVTGQAPEGAEPEEDELGEEPPAMGEDDGPAEGHDHGEGEEAEPPPPNGEE